LKVFPFFSGENKLGATVCTPQLIFLGIFLSERPGRRPQGPKKHEPDKYRKPQKTGTSAGKIKGHCQRKAARVVRQSYLRQAPAVKPRHQLTSHFFSMKYKMQRQHLGGR